MPIVFLPLVSLAVGVCRLCPDPILLVVCLIHVSLYPRVLHFQAAFGHFRETLWQWEFVRRLNIVIKVSPVCREWIL